MKDMKSRVEKELKEEINGDFGYFEGKQSAKRWITEEEDITQMYRKHKSGEIHLWRSYKEPPRKKTKGDTGCTRREQKEINIEKAYEELYEKHQKKYTKHG